MGDHYKRFNTNKPLKVGECDGNTCYKPTSKELKSHDRKNNCWIGTNSQGVCGNDDFFTTLE